MSQFLMLFSAILFGNLNFSAETMLNQIQEENHFSEGKEVTLTAGEEFAIAEETNVTEALEDVKVEPADDPSIVLEVEKETGTVLQQQKLDLEVVKDISPVLEDLEELAEKPAITAVEVPKADPYDTLEITIQDKHNISKILTTMAENSIFKLLFERKRLERLGQEISHIHPVRFLGTVFTDPRLTGCMRRIRTSSFKWDGFIDGFSERFKGEIRAGNVNAYIPGLAESVGVKPEDLQGYVDYKDFEGLVIFLLEKTRNR